MAVGAERDADRRVPPGARQQLGRRAGLSLDRAHLVGDGLLTVQEAAPFLGVSRAKLYALMEAGEIPKGDPALIAAMSLGVVMQSGLNKIYNRLPGPFSQHVDTFTRTIMAILQQK